MKRVLHVMCLLFMALNLFAQSLSISGNVIASDDNMPLPGVNVRVKGAQVGTISDFDGNFTLSIKKGDVLAFSYMGYQTQELKVVGADPLKVSLEPDNMMLEEVVAIGYGTMKKSDLTGAVSSVKSEQLQKSPVAGLDQALQGRAAGVTVNANTGQPGAAAEVRIRGIGTVNNSAPIYVVDGFILDNINFLSPSDIESTEILKDASATAIYGSRGANGVILVTTKQGTQGKTNVSFNSYVGIQNRWNKIDLMKSKEFAETIIALNGVKSEIDYYNNKGFNRWLQAYRLGNSPYYPTLYSTSNPTGFNYSKVETDWQDEVFRTAMIQNYHLNIDGATDKMNYSMSASYFNQEGTIIGSNYDRLTLRINTGYKIRKWLKIGENLNFSSSRGRNAMNNNASPGASILSAALAMAPWDPTHYPEGSLNLEGKDLGGQISASSNFRNVVNPYSMVQNSEPLSQVERWVGDVFLELTPVKGLMLRSSVSMDLSNNRDRLYKAAYEYSSYDKADKNFLSSSMSRYSTMILQNILSYNEDFGKHAISAMVGQTTEEYNYYTIGGSGASILNPTSNNWYLSQTTDDRTYAADGVGRSRMFSLLGRIHYSYNNKYMITANLRADASEKFPENLYGYFPSTAFGWRLSEEPWMKNIKYLDFVKIRAGWGQIGNEKIGTSNFTNKIFNTGPTFVDYVFGMDQTLVNGATVLTYVNAGGKWETTEQWNVGVDFGLFGKLTGNIDIYNRDTKDMLLNVKAPAHVGNRYDAVANVATVRNQGLEISLDHQNSIGEFKYGVGGNLSFVKNKLTALNGGEPVYGDFTICNEGLPLYTFWGYQYEGVYASDQEAQDHLYFYTADTQPYHAGDARFIDLNDDGKIDDSDKTSLGNPFPWLTYGINLSMQYLGFDAQLFFQGVYGNQIYNAMRIRTEGKGTEATLSSTMRDVWTISNPDGAIPNPYGNPNNSITSSRFVESGAYFRLKNVQLGYTLPTELTKRATINKCRFYLSANNLFTLTKYSGYDPEVGNGIDYGNYPQSRTFTLGVNVEF